MTRTATYVYCFVAHRRPLSVARVPRGLPGTGPVRLLDVPAVRRGATTLSRSLVVADAPLARYGERAIAKHLSDLSWVSRAAIAHERVVEAFIAATAVVPMKLFTLFSDDRRAVESIREHQARVDRVLKRVSDHREWGVRVMLDRARGPARSRPKRAGTAAPSGAGYLAQKKEQRDAVVRSAADARATATDLFDHVAPLASEARRRTVTEVAGEGGPLLLDAVFLVDTRREKRFRTAVERRARSLAAAGYHVALTGPWPPYGFIED